MGDLRSSAPGEFGALRLASAVITFEDDTVTLDDLAVGDVVVQVWADVTTAFNAGTTNVLVVGTAADDDHFLAASDVTEGTPGVTPAGGKGPFPVETVADAVIAKYTQTGTAATTGAARVYALISSVPR